ncbi:MAG: hypothetical protein Q7U47_11835 [Paludibacter sp.]|nr:hypothetical protein [Paludibacter sp.]
MMVWQGFRSQGSSLTGDTAVAPYSPTFLTTGPLGASVKKTTQRTICYIKTEKKKRNNEQPTHKTAHLQTTQANTRPIPIAIGSKRAVFLANAPLKMMIFTN